MQGPPGGDAEDEPCAVIRQARKLMSMAATSHPRAHTPPTLSALPGSSCRHADGYECTCYFCAPWHALGYCGGQAGATRGLGTTMPRLKFMHAACCSASRCVHACRSADDDGTAVYAFRAVTEQRSPSKSTSSLGWMTGMSGQGLGGAAGQRHKYTAVILL
jgi:hypothetical protein